MNKEELYSGIGLGGFNLDNLKKISKEESNQKCYQVLGTKTDRIKKRKKRD